MKIVPNEITSVGRTLNEIKREVETNRKLLVDDLKKVSKKQISELSSNLSQKEKVDYHYKVQPHFDQIYKLVATGYKKSDIADVLGVTKIAFRNMCREIGELRALMEVATEDKIDSVEASLFQIATGYTVEEQVINSFNGDVTALTQYKAPVLGAIKYVLGNKRATEYADKKQIINKVELGTEITDALKSLSISDLQRALTIANSENAIDVTFSEVGVEDGET